MDHQENNHPEGHISFEDLIAGIAKDIPQRPPPYSEDVREEKQFPLEILPLKAQEYVKGANTALGVPQDFFAASMVFTAAAAAGNTCYLEVKRGVRQKAVQYLVLVGLPNSNKSGALKAAVQPLINKDADNFDVYQAEMDAYLSEQAKPKKQRQPTTKPIFQRVVIQDITPEAVAGALMDSPRGMTLYRDELTAFVKDFNRYNQGSEQEFWLSNWSGTYLSIDRKTSEPVRIKGPFLPVIGTIQPGVLEELVGGNRSVNGFIDRLLFCWPGGLEKTRWARGEVSRPLWEAWQTAIERLLDLPPGENDQPRKLFLSEEAREQLFHFFNEDNKPLCDQAESELLAGIYGKFDFHCIRLAIALHLLHWAYEGEEELPEMLTTHTVGQAIEATRYFRRQALKVYQAIHSANPVDKLPANKRRLYEALPERFKKKEGQAIAKRMGIAERTFTGFVVDKKLFEKVKYGEYAKIY